MKKMNRKTKASLVGAILLVVIASTWAFFTAESRIENDLYTKKYGADTIEKFKPEQELEPGTQIEKKVGVKNTGEYDLVVRVKFEEAWARNTKAFVNLDSVGAEGFNEAIVSAIKNETTGEVTSKQGSETDGAVTNDETVMYKSLPGLAAGKWIKGNDGWFYYATVLEAGLSTELLMDSLTLAGDTDMGIYNSVKKYSKTKESVINPLEEAYEDARVAYLADKDDVEKKAAMDKASEDLEVAYGWSTDAPAAHEITYQKVETTLDENAQGYAAADYTLTIVTQVCQATKNAIDAEWIDMDDEVKASWGLK